MKSTAFVDYTYTHFNETNTKWNKHGNNFTVFTDFWTQ